MKNKNIALLAYVPVIHKGYFDFLHELKRRGVETLYLISDEILSSHIELDYLNRKDRVRAIPETQMIDLLNHLDIVSVKLLTKDLLLGIQQSTQTLVMPDEDNIPK